MKPTVKILFNENWKYGMSELFTNINIAATALATEREISVKKIITIRFFMSRSRVSVRNLKLISKKKKYDIETSQESYT